MDVCGRVQADGHIDTGKKETLEMQLRDFLYLDWPLVKSFLAQLEGGNFDEETEREESKGGVGFGGKVGITGLGASLDAERSRTLTSEAVIRQSAASEFDRLYKHLEASNLRLIEQVESADEVQVGRKEFIEVDGRVRAGGFAPLAGLLGSFQRLASLMPAGSQGLPDTAQLEAFAALAVPSGGASTALVLNVGGAAGYTIATEVNPEFVAASRWDVDATALLKVQKVLRVGETYVLPGGPMADVLRAIPEEQRAEAAAMMATPEARQLGIGELHISGPGLVATAIAIYR